MALAQTEPTAHPNEDGVLRPSGGRALQIKAMLREANARLR